MVSKSNKYQKELLNSQQVPHFGLRKLGIGVTSVLLGTTFYFGGNTANVHADVTSATVNNENAAQTVNANSAENSQAVALKTAAPASTQASSASATTQPNWSGVYTLVAQPAATSASSANSNSQSGVDVPIDHSALSNAVSGAQKAGLETYKTPEQTFTTSQTEAANAQKQLETNEQQQAQEIQNQTNQYEHATSNVAKMNSAANNHADLDTAIKNAQSAGVLISADSNKATEVNPADDSAVNNWIKNTQTDYTNQAKNIQSKIAEQQKNNEEYQQNQANYQKNLATWESKNIFNLDGLSSDEIPQELHLDASANTSISVKLDSPYVTKVPDSTAYTGITYTFQRPKNNYISGPVLTITYTNLGDSYYTVLDGKTVKKNKIGKIVRVISDIQEMSNSYTPTLQFYGLNSVAGFGASNINHYMVSDTFFDVNGNKINLGPNAYYSCGSLNAEYYKDGKYISNMGSDGKPQDGKPATVQYIEGTNGSKAVQLAGSTITVHTDGKAYSDFTNDIGGGMHNGKTVTSDESVWTQYAKSNGYKLNPTSSSDAWDNPLSPARFFGTGVVQGSKDGTLTVITGVNVPSDSESQSMAGWGTGYWTTFDTTIPSNARPTKAAKLKQVTADYYYNKANATVKTPLISYHYNKLSVVNNIQRAQVIYRDVNNKPQTIGQDAVVTGNAGDKVIDSNVDSNITNFENKGYVLKNNGFEGAVFDNNDGTQYFYIDFVHGKDTKTTTKTVTRTIHYTSTDGQAKVPADVKQPVQFTETQVIDKVTKQPVSTTWSADQTVTGEKTPVVNGYYVTNVDKDSTDKVNVAPKTISHDGQDYTVTVTYAPVGSIVPVDPNGNPIPNPSNPKTNVPNKSYTNDPSNPAKVTPNEPVPTIPGWTPEKDNVTPTNPGKNTIVHYTQDRTPEVVDGSLVYVDDTTGNTLGGANFSGQAGTKINYTTADQIANYEKLGYKLVSNNFKDGNETFNADPAKNKFTVHLVHTTSHVDKNHPGHGYSRLGEDGFDHGPLRHYRWNSFGPAG